MSRDIPLVFPKKRRYNYDGMHTIEIRGRDRTKYRNVKRRGKSKKRCQCGKRTSSKRIHFKKILDMKSSYPCVFAGIALNMSRYSYHISANN